MPDQHPTVEEAREDVWRAIDNWQRKGATATSADHKKVIDALAAVERVVRHEAVRPHVEGCEPELEARAVAAEARVRELERVLREERERSLRFARAGMEVGEKYTRLVEAAQALADLWMQQQAEYPPSEGGQHAAAAVRVCARELRAALTVDVVMAEQTCQHPTDRCATCGREEHPGYLRGGLHPFTAAPCGGGVGACWRGAGGSTRREHP